MSWKRRCEMVDCLKNSMWAKLAMVRGGFSKFEFQHDLHGRYFRYQRNIFNSTEVRRSWHVDKQLNCKLVYTNETDDDLRLESQIFANSRVILVKHNKPIMPMGLPKSCKRYGNGVSVVAAKCRFYTTAVIGSEGEGKQSVSSIGLNRSNWRGLDKENTTNKIYDALLNPNLIWEAYWKISKKKGANTKSVNNETLDGFSEIDVVNIIKKLKDQSFAFKPLKRIYIEKSNGKKRPLGIPNPKDKIVLKAMSMLLEKIYEPEFLNTNHGFRPNCGTHTALKSITKWSGTKWFIEGDITAYFDSIQHHLLIQILSKKISDKRFLDLCWKAIRVKYAEFPNVNIEKANVIGTPQGSSLSPVLANIFLHEFDLFMDTLIKESKDSGFTSKDNPEYKKIHSKISHLRQALLPSWKYKPISEEKKQERLAEILRLEKLRRRLPSKIKSEGFRIYYVRYADDFLIGINGNEVIAKTVKLKIENFLKDKLNLSLNVSKTKITSAITNRAYFLGAFIRAMTSRTNDQPNRKNSMTKLNRTVRARVPQGYIRCFAPIENIVKKLQEQGICKIYNFKNRQVVPTRKTSWVFLDTEVIIQKYNSLWTGLLNYYSFAYNRAQLNFIQYLLLHSAACTIMNKLKLSSRAKVFKKFGKELVVVKADKKKLIKEVKFNYQTTLKRLEKFNTGKKNDKNIGLPYFVFDYALRTRKLRNAQCSICGATSNIEMHHRRPLKASVTDNTLKGIVKNLTRKQIPLCKECHFKVHAVSYSAPGIY